MYSTLEVEVASKIKKHLGRGRAALGEMLGAHVEVESRGNWITTSQGRELLNLGGYGVFIAGARHPVVTAAVERQLHRHPVGSRLFFEPTVAAAAESLASVTPETLDRIYFCGSGTEATEAAIKIARLNGCEHLISMNNGYHGKTMGALSLTARPVYQDPFRPVLQGVDHVPFGDIDALSLAISESPSRVAVFVEPVQAEAGVIVPPGGYLRAVRKACTESNSLLVVDEIQTGFGRLGSWWGCDRESVVPDILLTGKALGGGVIPVAAAVTSSEHFNVLERDPLLHTSTFSGAPIAMAAVCAAVDVIRDEDFVSRAAAVGAIIADGVRAVLIEENACNIARVRDAGLLIGIEVDTPGGAAELLLNLIEHGVIANLSLNSSNVLRLTPAATLSDVEIELFLSAFKKAIRPIARSL